MICYDIYTRLVRQRTSLARLSTISHDFYTTSGVFLEYKEYVLLKREHGHILILPRERNKYDYSFEHAFFDAILCFFLEDMLVLKNAINKMRIFFQPLLDNNLMSAMT